MLDVLGVKQMLLALEKKTNRNQELRMKFADDPTKFVESEVDLDDELKKLHVLATAPELYGELIKHDSVVSLLHLLSHENSDISISTISLLHELTEIDTLAETEGALALVDALVRRSGVRARMLGLCVRLCVGFCVGFCVRFCAGFCVGFCVWFCVLVVICRRVRFRSFSVMLLSPGKTQSIRVVG